MAFLDAWYIIMIHCFELIGLYPCGNKSRRRSFKNFRIGSGDGIKSEAGAESEKCDSSYLCSGLGIFHIWHVYRGLLQCTGAVSLKTTNSL